MEPGPARFLKVALRAWVATGDPQASLQDATDRLLITLAGGMMTAMNQTPKPRRLRWFQYSLRTLLLVMLLASIGMSWFAVEIQKAKRRKEAVEAIKRLGGGVTYDYEVDALLRPIPRAKPPGPTWLQDLLGVDFLAAVADVGLHGPEVTDAALEHLEKLTRLNGLSLTDTHVTEDGLEHLRRLTRLQRLGIYGTRVTDAGLEHLKGLTQLQELSLNDTQITDAGLEHLSRLTQLEELSIASPDVTDTGLAHLEGLHRLTLLQLRCPRITDVGLAHLKALSELKRLELHCAITDAGMEHLNSLAKLSTLVSRGREDDSAKKRSLGDFMMDLRT